jgi:hypothetical protein
MTFRQFCEGLLGGLAIASPFILEIIKDALK